MAGYTRVMITLQFLVLATLVAIVWSGTVPEKLIGVPAAHQGNVDKIKDNNLMVTGPEGNKLEDSTTRAKRYAYGWGRRPGLRYSKATSVFDNDNLFNKIYNRYEKRGQGGPEAPISNFRELRMKQKVPNVQLLLPHLFNRNNRVPPLGTSDLESGSDLGAIELDGPGAPRLSDEDVEALMLFLEDYAKNLRANEQ